MNDEPSPPAQPAHSASSPYQGPAAAAARNGASSHQAGDDDGLAAEVLRESTLTLHAVEDIQTTVGVIQIQLAIGLALALLSLSILTYSLKRPVP